MRASSPANSTNSRKVQAIEYKSHGRPRRTANVEERDNFPVEAAVPAATAKSMQATRLPPQVSNGTSISESLNLNRESFSFEPAHDFVNDPVDRQGGSIDHFGIRRDDEW